MTANIDRQNFPDRKARNTNFLNPQNVMHNLKLNTKW
jgi:hypothetical protein